MNFTELQQRCKNRCFDQIVVVVKDIFQELADMRRIKNVTPGDVRICTHETDLGLQNADGPVKYVERRASFFYENIEICIVEPVAGETIYKKYLDRFGACICCVRERVAAVDFEGMVENYGRKGLRIAQWMASDRCKAAWLDLTEELGILFEIISDDSEKIAPAQVIHERIAQINITTPDVQKSIKALTQYLEIGPWEVGRQCNATVHDYGFRVDGKLAPAEFEFLLAILPCGNIEWEVIEPVKGPLVYVDFLKRRGVGYHHVLQEIPSAQWTQVQEAYEKAGAWMACKGSLGPVDWCYMNTETDLHFYTELRNDAVMDKLPDGYFAYFYPEPEP